MIVPILSDLLEDRVHTPTQSPVKVKKDGGDWYGHDGVDVKETHKAKGTVCCDHFMSWGLLLDQGIQHHKSK